MNHLDLFSGIGGFHLGLLQAGFKFDWTGHSEIDKYALEIYQYNFPESEDLGDVSGIIVSELPGIDIITFGFPCQDLSVAGKRTGLSGRRSGLFYEAMRIIKATTPEVFIFENVLGLYSSGDPRGGDFTAVLREISSLGLYECEWQTLNTRWFLPQNRERIYFIGHLRGRSRSKVFPFGQGDEIFEQSRGEGKVKNQSATAITQNLKRGVHSGGETLIQVGNIDTKGHNSIWGRVYDPEGCSATLNAKGGGMGAKTGLYKVKPKIIEDFYPDRVRETTDCPTLRSDRNGLKVNTFRRARTDEGKTVRSQNMKNGEDTTPFGMKEVIKEDTGIMPTLTAGDSVEQKIEIHNLQRRNSDRPSLTKLCDCGSKKLYKKCCGVDGGSGHLSKKDGTTYALDSNCGQGVKVESIIRRLTPIECARLQGFPDNWCEGISDTQQYKCYGNAVSVPVVEAIGRRLL